MIKSKMSSDSVIGSISKALNTGEFEWSIKLSDEILEKDGCLDSPTFSFSHALWFVRMYPKVYETPGYISLYLRKKDSQSEISVKYSLEMALNGMQLIKREYTDCFGKCENSRGWQKYIRTYVLYPSSEKTEDYSQLTIKLRMSDNVLLTEDLLLKKRNEGVKILCQNFKDMLHHDKGHDLILKVKDKEFKVHKIIMQYRCPVFKALIEHDMLEKFSGVIEIHDCDPIAFEHFIHYIYTGDLKTLDGSFMQHLYHIADKYQMACLKEMCREFLKKSLSPRNVCGVIRLALRHRDSTLLECGQEYLVDNVKEVVETVEFLNVMKGEPL